MVKFEAVVFDFIGTLTSVENYSLETSEEAMFKSLVSNGFTLDKVRFMNVYKVTYQKYHNIRYSQLVEVNNSVWISEALNIVNYRVKLKDTRVRNAIVAFFENYLDALMLQRSAILILQRLTGSYKIGLISNFTHAPLIYAGLRKLEIDNYFNAILVSDAIGWRKPSPKIFEEAIKRLQVKANTVLFVGDTPLEDIQGAKNVGMKTAFIPSQFNTLADMKNAEIQPDYYIEKLEDLLEIIKI